MALFLHPLTGRQVYFLVPGVLTFPGRSDNWTGRVATGLFLRGAGAAEKVEYLSGPLFHRLLGQRKRVKKLVRTLSFYLGWDWVFVGHSNGAEVILKALRYLEQPRVRTLHLVAPVCDCRLLKDVDAKEVVVYQGGKDWLARLAASWAGRLLRYGGLGVGRRGISAFPRLRVVRRAEFGHSDWFWEPNLPWMLDELTGRKETR